MSMGGMISGPAVTITLVSGSVVESPSAANPLVSPNLAVELYFGRKAAMSLPDPNNRRGGTLLTQANPGDTTLNVSAPDGDIRLAYKIGDALFSYTYMGPVPPSPLPTPPWPVEGPYSSESVTFLVTGFVDATHVQVSPPVPASAVNVGGSVVAGGFIPANTVFGFTGPSTDWKSSVNKQLLSTLQQLSALAGADAVAIIDHIQNNAYTSGSTVAGAATGSSTLTVSHGSVT